MTPHEMETAIARLFEGQDLLTGKVTELTDDVAHLTQSVTELSHSVNTMREQAEADRAVQREAIEEMRTAMGTMLSFAESMAANVTLLTKAQQGTTQRVNGLQERVTALEQGQPPGGSGNTP
jgi:hypothetical protein